MRVVMREAGEEKGVCQSVCLTAGATPPSELFGAEVALSVLPRVWQRQEWCRLEGSVQDTNTFSM